MRRAIYFQVVVCFIMCSKPASSPRDSYPVEYFCFDGYKGIGVVSVSSTPGSYAVPILAEPVDGSNQVATFVADISPDKKRFSVQNLNIATNALFEFDYEQLGLPIELTQDNWIRVRIGTDFQGNQLAGWISATADLLIKTWDTYLPDRATFLANCDKPLLYESPDGKSFLPNVNYLFDDNAKIKRPDYRINYLEKNGEWLKIQFITPSDLCGRSAQGTVITEGWIPFLFEDKTPAVWFFPRGC